MGLVKFNNTTLAIDTVPDGHLIVLESEVSGLRQVRDAFNLLKSKMPVGVSEDQLTVLVEKGQKFDVLSQEKTNFEKQFKDTSTKLEGFKNIPEDFKVEKWNEFKTREAGQQRETQLTELTTKVKTEFQKEHGYAIPSVDARFIDQSKIASLDLTKSDANATLLKIIDDGHTAQQDFISKQFSSGVPATAPAGQPVGAAIQPTVVPNPANSDRVGADGMHVGGFRT